MKVNIRMTYPKNEEFDFKTQLKIINLDEEREKGLMYGADFIITEPQGAKKDTDYSSNKSDRSIFSSRYGSTIMDSDAYIDRYRCDCGRLRGTLYHNEYCSVCNTKVKYMDDDFDIFGWVILQDGYKVIHPTLYKCIESLIGPRKLPEIITQYFEYDVDGFIKSETKPNKDKYFGIGMIEFVKHIDEILEYYKNKNKSNKTKLELYDHIMAHRDCLLTSSIPVYTLFLRPVNISGDKFVFEKNNKWYNNIAKNAAIVNKNKMIIQRSKKTKDAALLDIQNTFNTIYGEIVKILSGKKGVIRSSRGGRYNFSARGVIIPYPNLRIDEVIMPYNALVVLLEQTIVNILVRSYNISYSEAYKKWWKSQIVEDDVVISIIRNIIKNYPRGIPLLINRNPSINYGSILQMYCIDVALDSFTVYVPLQILQTLGADFDGDCMNILYLINKEFVERCEKVFNPRNALMISRNDGNFNNRVNHFKDTIVNLNSFIYLSRDGYSKEELQELGNLHKL